MHRSLTPTPRTEARPPATRRLEAESPDTERHLEFAAKHFAEPEVARWHWPGALGGARSPEQVREMLIVHAVAEQRDGFTLWWWRERASGELVGMVGLRPAEVQGIDEVEVGWSVSPRFWGQGYAPEAAAASLRWGFEVAGLERIVSYTMVENRPSQRVMEKLGMERETEFDHHGLPHVLYALAAPRSA